MSRPSHDRPRHEPGSQAGPVLFVLGLLVGLVGAMIADRVTSLFVDRDIELVRAVRNLALESFVDEVRSEDLIDDALSGMLEGLDRYSRFYDHAEIAQVHRETTGEFRGIGIVFRRPPEGHTSSRPEQEGQILFAFPGSPAAEAGLSVGDRLIEVGGRAVADMEPGELQTTIQSAGEGPLHVLVEDLTGDRREVDLHPRPVVDPTVRHARMIDPEAGIGYLSILSFSRRTPEEFDRAVEELQACEPPLRRLVVDLRSNPGGILDAAVAVANRFIPEGTIVATRERSGTEVTEAKPEEALFAEIPLVLLVDPGSASASEVLAGALQDHCVAALVGEATYGKGTVQTLKQISGERGIVKLTTAIYYTPSWRRIERDESGETPSGIAPDYLVELDPEERRGIHAYLHSYSPPPSALPAIESWEEEEDEELWPRPPDDRQLDAAVALLTGGGPPVQQSF